MCRRCKPSRRYKGMLRQRHQIGKFFLLLLLLQTHYNIELLCFFFLFQKKKKRKLTQVVRFFSKGMREPVARLPPRITGRWPTSASTLEPSLLSMATARGKIVSSQLWLRVRHIHKLVLRLGIERGRSKGVEFEGRRNRVLSASS